MEVSTGGGATVGEGVKAGRDFVGRDVRRLRRDSHNVTIRLNESLQALQSELLQIQMDVKLLHNMAEERKLQVMQLQGWVIIMGVALLIQSISFVFFVIVVWR